MTDKERNAFERELQKDLFTEEASEGFKEIDAGLAENDILKLRKLVKRRTSAKQRAIWFRIAASVAVLMILSSILIIVNRNKPSEQIAYSPASPPSEEVMVSPEHKAAEEKLVSKEKVDVIHEKSKQVPVETKKPEGQPFKENELRPIKENEVLPVIENDVKAENISEVSQDAVIVEEAAEPTKLVAAERAMASKSVLAKGIRGVEFEKEDTVAGRIPPQPVSGRADFDKYIQNNIRRPDTTTTGQRVVVVLNFIVKTDGIIDSIRIIRSPGKSFSDEAVRLIREGPPWKPAEENGKVISDEVRIRIVFK
jgi:protein TonB